MFSLSGLGTAAGTANDQRWATDGYQPYEGSSRTIGFRIYSNLIDLLNVLGLLIDLEEKQLDLLHAILSATQIGVDSLTAGGVLPIPPDARKPVRWSSPEDNGTLF